MRVAATVYRELTADRRGDGELLAAFLCGPSEEAFAELVRRHGPCVWGACRRLLPDPADAEDAFQATFLVLVRRAHRLTHCAALGSWLHAVAVGTARNVRRKNARRLARQSALPDRVPDPAPQPDPDLKADLDAALIALPARYRDPIVLCHLLGFSRREAAERLGCPEGTISAWLSRGLAKLRVRLRGLDPTKTLSVAAVSVPAALAASTARAAVATAVAAAGVPPTVSVLVEGVLRMFWVKKATATAFALCAVFALGLGVGLGTRSGQTGAGAQDGPVKAPAAKSKELRDLENEAKELAAEYESLLQSDANVRTVIEQLTEQIKKGETDPKKLRLLADTLEKLQKEAEVVAVKLKATKDKLDQLKHTAKPRTDPATAADIDVELLKLRGQIELLMVERKKLAGVVSDAEQKAKDIDAKIKAILEAAPRLQAKRNESVPRTENTIQSGGYLELSVVSTQVPMSEFALKEIDAAGKVLGTVVTREPEMLAKLLARTRSDSTAPKELRVVAQPTTALTGWPVSALKACDAAGYKTVKFTGYVFGGGYATSLKPDQKGEVAGYKHYESAEKKPAELVKEIQEGMARF